MESSEDEHRVGVVKLLSSLGVTVRVESGVGDKLQELLEQKE